MPLILFEDDHVDQLLPLVLGRAAFAVSCGGYRLIDLVDWYHGPRDYLVRPHLTAITQADFPVKSAGEIPGSLCTVVNASLVPSAEAIERLKHLVRAGQPGVVRFDDRIAVALLPPNATVCSATLEPEKLVAELAKLDLPLLDGELPLFEYAHDVVKYHTTIFQDNLGHRIAAGNYHQLQDGVFLAEGARVAPHVVFDTSAGPIVLEPGASVGPHCYLRGPILLGSNAQIVSHSHIQGGVAAGHTTKLGGEVASSIIEPYSNKSHYGFLGNSYLGSWVNLGAGTTTSNLKNTYGTINVEYGGLKVATGMQFFGCAIGDYTKSAVNTSIFTGKLIGVGSMLYGFVTSNVPSFVNFARSFGQVSEVSVEVAATVQQRMFARRNVPCRPCDEQLLRDMFELTAAERVEFDDCLSAEPLAL
jgi:glucose-1-phosphate thymidylyltransferase